MAQIPSREESLQWWKDQIGRRYKNKYKKMERRRIGVGSMVIFQYDAKGKSTLPFWDKHPLPIIFGETSKHFIGINLHYIHPKFRATVLKKIINLNKLRIRNDRRFYLEYRMIKKFLIQYNLTISIRKYIKGRMSKVTYIKASDWKYSIHVPSEKFVFNGNMDRDKLYKLIAMTGKAGGDPSAQRNLIKKWK